MWFRWGRYWVVWPEAAPWLHTLAAVNNWLVSWVGLAVSGVATLATLGSGIWLERGHHAAGFAAVLTVALVVAGSAYLAETLLWRAADDNYAVALPPRIEISKFAQDWLAYARSRNNPRATDDELSLRWTNLQGLAQAMQTRNRRVFVEAFTAAFTAVHDLETAQRKRWEENP